MQITANGIALEYQETGPEDGPALVLIRGLGSQMIHWPAELIGGFAARGYRTVIFDNRDTGLSARCPAPGITTDADAIITTIRAGRTPRPAYTLDDMAADVIGLMDALKIARAHVFGISMGGAIAQILAIRHAERLRSSTIVMSAPSFSAERIQAVLMPPLDRAAFIEAAVRMDRDWGSPGYPMAEDQVRAQAALVWDRGAQADGVNRQALATAAGGDRRKALQGIALPCLVIHGSDDVLVPVAAGREIAALIPGAECQIIDGMGHVITPLLAPLIVERVDRFIRDRT